MKHPGSALVWICFAVLGALIYWGWRYNNDVLFIGGIVVGSIALAIDLTLLSRKMLREEKERDQD